MRIQTYLSARMKLACVLCLVLALLAVANSSTAQTTGGGPGDPVPVVDMGVGTKAIVVRLDFAGREQVSLTSAKMVVGRAHGHIGDPPLLQVRLLDQQGQLIEAYNALNPLWAYRWDAGREHRITLPRASGRFVLPFSTNLETMRLVDIPLNRPLIDVDLRPSIRTFCQANLRDPDCKVADLALSLAVLNPPARMQFGPTATVTIRTTVRDIASPPAGALSAHVTRTLTADAGLSVSPTTPVAADLAVNGATPQTLDQQISVSCLRPGRHRVTLNGAVEVGRPAYIVETNTANNRAEASFTVDCVAPIYASDSLDLRDRVVVGAPYVYGGQSFTLGADAVVRGSVEASGNAFLRSRARIEGDLTLAGTLQRQDGVVITGAVRQGTSVLALGLPTQSVVAGTTNLTVANGQSASWAPGSYGDGMVRARGTLTLRAGTYTFRSLRFEPDTRLILSPGAGTIQVNVVDALEFGDRAQVEGGSPTTVTFYTNSAGQVRVGTNVLFRGLLIAPQGELHVFSRTTTTAQLWAKRIIIEPDVATQ
jgi:hypothetical protein